MSDFEQMLRQAGIDLAADAIGLDFLSTPSRVWQSGTKSIIGRSSSTHWWAL